MTDREYLRMRLQEDSTAACAHVWRTQAAMFRQETPGLWQRLCLRLRGAA